MKKILTAIALIACLVLPLSAMSMTAIGDNEMSAITGQAGVSIGADLSMNLSLGTVAWGDLDGLAAAGNAAHDTNTTAGGWVGIQNLTINNLRIHMRTDDAMADLNVAAALGSSMGIGTWANAAAVYADLQSATESVRANAEKAVLLSVLATQQLLTIDIYTASAKTYVRIGLPTFEVKMGDLTLNAGLFTNSATNTPGTYQSLGQVFVGGLNVLLDKNNYVDISQNNTTSGVLIHVANLTAGQPLMHVGFTAASWGDLDGLNAYPNGAGFVGVKGMNLAVGMDMVMNINVGTATGAGIPGILSALGAITTEAGLVAYKTGLIALIDANNAGVKDSLATILHNVGAISKTSVDIALSGSLNVSTMATQVVLADNAALAGSYTGVAGSNAGILGNLYISGLNLTILGDATGATPGAPQSWVSISAH